MARRTPARSGASSSMVDDTNTRIRWSGVRTAEGYRSRGGSASAAACSIALILAPSGAGLARANGIPDPNRIFVGQVLDMPGGASTREISAYSRLGTWVDVYDYAPAFDGGASVPQLSPTSVAAMAAAGIRTLYLQAA